MVGIHAEYQFRVPYRASSLSLSLSLSLSWLVRIGVNSCHLGFRTETVFEVVWPSTPRLLLLAPCDGKIILSEKATETEYTHDSRSVKTKTRVNLWDRVIEKNYSMICMRLIYHESMVYRRTS